MRIVQTFWTAGQDPLKHAFGWLHPEYNLMSWTLSCLSLREHYDEVALYTDSEGKRILIDKLHLPYTEVNVIFDDFPCLPQHWALAKIKTYSLQTEPFLHVDGALWFIIGNYTAAASNVATGLLNRHVFGTTKFNIYFEGTLTIEDEVNN